MTNRSSAETTTRRFSEHDITVPYWPSDMAYPVDERIPYRLTESAPHYEDMPQRAREAWL